MELVGGHPYLIQLALYHLQQGILGLEQLLHEATTSLSIYRNHLRGCLKKLEADPVLQAAFQQVLVEGEILLPPAIAYRLESIGLVRLTSAGATVRCNLYRLYYKACVDRSSRCDQIAT